MNLKIVFVLVLVAAIITAGCVQKQEKKDATVVTPPETNPQVKLPLKYSTEPFMTCADCRDAKKKEFEKQCSDNNGVFEYIGSPPLSAPAAHCYQKAPDLGKECASGNDCLSGFCNLYNGISSEKCKLIKKDITGRIGRGGPETYNANYSCTTNKPGTCTATRDLSYPFSGIDTSFTMEGTVLIEVVEEGPVT